MTLFYVSGYELEGDGGDAILNFWSSNQELTVYYAPAHESLILIQKIETVCMHFIQSCI